jgi:hypothetical protein
MWIVESLGPNSVLVLFASDEREIVVPPIRSLRLVVAPRFTARWVIVWVAIRGRKLGMDLDRSVSSICSSTNVLRPFGLTSCPRSPGPVGDCARGPFAPCTAGWWDA